MFALTFTMTLGLVVVLLEFREDFYTRILLKVFFFFYTRKIDLISLTIFVYFRLPIVLIDNQLNLFGGAWSAGKKA